MRLLLHTDMALCQPVGNRQSSTLMRFTLYGYRVGDIICQCLFEISIKLIIYNLTLTYSATWWFWKSKGKYSMFDLRTNHACVASPLSSTRSYHSDEHHYDVTATYESDFKASCRKISCRSIYLIYRHWHWHWSAKHTNNMFLYACCVLVFHVFFVLVCVFVCVRTIFSWCSYTWYGYIVYNIISLNISLIYI